MSGELCITCLPGGGRGGDLVDDCMSVLSMVLACVVLLL